MVTHKKAHTPGFVDRVHELRRLDDFLQHPPSAAQHIAIIAPRRMGKSQLIGAFRRAHPKAVLPYVDVEAAEGNLERLVLRILVGVVTEVTAKRAAASDVTGLASLLVLAAGLPTPQLERIRELVERVTAGRLPHDDAIRESIVLAEKIASGQKKSGIIFFDECQDWFAGPGEKPTKLESILRELGEAGLRLRFGFAGSATRVMEATFRESEEGPGRPRRPLHGRVELLALGALPREDTRKIVADEWRHQKHTREALERVYVLTRGHPAVSVHLAERAARNARNSGYEIDAELVSTTFVAEIFERGGYINAILEADFKSATFQPRGSTALQQAATAIAELGPDKATLTQIAAATNLAASNLHAWFPHLLDVDFLSYSEPTKTYALKNPMIAIWLRGRDQWTPGGTAPVPPRFIALLEEELARTRQELGSTFEARVRDTAQGFDGRSVYGTFFGKGGPLQLPRVSTPVRAIKEIDTNGLIFDPGTEVELDVCIRGREIWLGEVKRKGHAATGKDINHFLKKCEYYRRARRMRIKQRWFVSGSGFDDKAIALATANDVLMTTMKGLTGLERELVRATTTIAHPAGPRAKKPRSSS